MKNQPPNASFPAEEEEVHSLFESLRASVVTVSEAFAVGVRDRLDAVDRTRGPGFDTVLGGLLVEVLNFVSASIEPDDDEDPPPE